MLTDSKIKALKPREKSYKVADGGGLYLLVTPTGGKLWRLKYRMDGRENVVSFGEHKDVGLAAVRIKAGEARALIAQGVHPIAHKKAQAAAKKAEELNSFGAVTQAWIEANAKSWKPYTLSQVRAFMGRYVIENKALADTPIRNVQTKDVRALLQSIAQRTTLSAGERKKGGAVTVARLVRSWCRAVFEYAIERDLAVSDPTYPLRNLTELKRPASSIKHNKKLSPKELKQLLVALDNFTGTRQTGIAIELLLLFFVRTGELRMARWEEFDLKKRQWRIPATRMKAGKPHLVPISNQALALLKEQQGISGTTGWVFPNQRRPEDCMSSTTINRALERMGFNGKNSIGLAAHGFRGTASTLLHELQWNTNVVETQLAHTPRNKVHAAYNAAQYIPERTEMMQFWADYLDSVRKDEIQTTEPAIVST
jgi:integrase